MARADGKPVDRLLTYLWDNKGTDLLLTAGAPPLVRIDGALSSLEGDEPLVSGQVEKLTAAMFTPEQAETFRLRREIDFSFNWQGKARFRGNAFMQRGSVGLALRLIPYYIPSFDELGLPPAVERFVQLPQGLVLVTGPTGAGKSTTLASMIDYINEHRRCHILTIEDPIEYVHKHKQSAVNQREVGEDTDSFQQALRSAVREDPDVLLVGEMRDLETIQITLTIAETGHLVFATLHTNDTAQAIDRIVDVFPGDRQDQIRVQLANSLSGIIHQRLVPRIGGGRVAAFEVLVATHAVRNLIKEGKSRQLRNALTTGQQEGMQTLEMALSSLVERGLVSHDEAVTRSLFAIEVLPKAPSSPEPLPGRRARRR